MYHVTNVCHKDDNQKHPKWNVIKPNVANDATYDGHLVGLPVACFTTTLFQGRLPDQSPYPRLQQDGTEVPVNTKHCRASVTAIRS